MIGVTSYPILSIDSATELHALLVRFQLCRATDQIDKIEKAGDGNMNLVLRVVTGDTSFIVKQSRPWVEKYPSIAASDERILAETDFYRRTASHPHIRSTVPRVLAADPETRILVMSDLGSASDYVPLYLAKSEDQLSVDQVFEQAAEWLAGLHEIAIEKDQREKIGCRSIRELNRAHLFSIPVQDPAAMDLDTVCDGLHRQSEPFRADKLLADAMCELGDRYMSVGDHLLHGDYYPGSWLQTEQGFRVIDPEFCFAGPTEYDLGILIAHRVFCGAEPNIATIEKAIGWYPGIQMDVSLAMQFAGMELIRRIIGVAQLPLVADLPRRLGYLETGRDWVLDR